MSGPQLPEHPGREPSAAELATGTDPRLGIAYAVNVRNEGGGENSVTQVILSYRLHRRGPDGSTLPALQVEMRGRQLQGMVAEGDLIQAPAPLPPAGVMQLEAGHQPDHRGPVVLTRPRTSGCVVVSCRPPALGVLFVLAIVVSLLAGS